MRPRAGNRRLLCSFFALVIGIAWAVVLPTRAVASTTGISQALPVQTDPFVADSSAARPDSIPAARPDSIPAHPDSAAAARPDSTAPSDSAGAGTAFKPRESVLPDTLEFLPPPGSRTGGEPKAGGAEGTPGAPKQRVGFLGIHPIAILFGIAALNYFIIKAVTD